MATTSVEQQVLSEFAARMMILRPQHFNDVVSRELTATVERIIRIRHDMEMQGLDGPRGAKVFVGCSIPVWEAIALHSGPFAPFADHPAAHAKVLQLLSAAYPDAKDHRCFFQGIWLRGGDGDLEPGHLHVPKDFTSTSWTTAAVDSSVTATLCESAQSYIRCVERLSAVEFELGLARKQATSIVALRDTCRVLEKVLQGLVLLEGVTGSTVGGAALARNIATAARGATPAAGADGGVAFEVTPSLSSSASLSTSSSGAAGAFTTSSLCSVLTRVVMLCYRTKETAEFPKGLNSVLISSEWLKRTVGVTASATSSSNSAPAPQEAVTLASFGDIFSPMVELWGGLVKREVRMGLTCEAPVAAKDRDAAVKQWRTLVRSQPPAAAYTRRYTGGAYLNNGVDESKLAVVDTLVANDNDDDDAGGGSSQQQASSSLTRRRCCTLVEKLDSDIPGEVRFDNKSATLRDTDSLVKFLRDIVRMPTLPTIGGQQVLHQLLFDRSRKRERSDGGGEVTVSQELEGRVLLPVVDSIDVAFGGSDGSQRTVMTPQERIIVGLHE